MRKSTEEVNSFSTNIEKWNTAQIIKFIHISDIEAFEAVGRSLDKITGVADLILETLSKGGRAIYVGAGTSGRIAVQDLVELLPTYGLGKEYFDYVMAGGERALTESVEGSEDSRNDAIESLKKKNLSSLDVVVGITASGSTPFVLAALEYAKSIGAKTVGITDNLETPVSKIADICIELLTGAEVIQGSTRMKAGTAQKMTLNMISTTVAVKLGRTYKNTMSHMGSWFNEKLKSRAVSILTEQFGLEDSKAEELLSKNDYNISKAIDSYKKEKLS